MEQLVRDGNDKELVAEAAVDVFVTNRDVPEAPAVGLGDVVRVSCRFFK